MLGRALTAGIVVFWLVMMGILALREIVPAWEQELEYARSASYEQLESVALKRPVTQMGIYFGKTRVGRTLSVLTKAGTELRLESRTEIDLRPLPMGSAIGAMFFGAPQVNLHFNARADEGRLTDLALVVRSAPENQPKMRLEGRPVGDQLRVTMTHYGERPAEGFTPKVHPEGGPAAGPGPDTYMVPFDSRQLLTNSLTPAFAFPELEVGRHFYLRTLNPSTGAVQKVRAEVTAKERITIAGKDYDAFRIAIPLPLGVQRGAVWVSAEGEVLRQEILGIVFVREEPPEDALERVRQ